MDKITVDTYNNLAKEYDEETADFWKCFPDSVITKFSDAVGKGGKVLDVGSGPGRDAVLLKNKSLEVVCLDASTVMVSLCKDKGLNAIVGDMLDMPFDDDTFDGVWAYTSLLHLRKSQIRGALKEIYRVLKDGGVFGLGLIEGTGEFYKESAGVGKPRWFAFYTEEEIEKLLENIGFRQVYFEKFKPRSKQYLNYVYRKA